MAKTLDLTGLTLKQIEQIYAMIETFRTINQHQQLLNEEQKSQFDPTGPRYIENQEITGANFGSASFYEHLNPPIKTYETSANSEDAIAQTITCIREANLAGNLTVVVPATEATIHLVQIIKCQGLIANFELVADATNKHLLLHLNPKGNNSSTNKITDRQFDWLNQEFPAEIVPLLQDLESEDPTVRARAVFSLGEFYSERTK